MHILLVEDETEFVNTLRSSLERARYVVDHAGTLAVAREAALSGSHDLVLLDRTLPDGDGLSLIPLLREKRSGVPVIVLSALGELPDRVTGLDKGADDYLAKPFALEELFARIRAVGRRPGGLHVETVNVGRLVFDPSSGEATVAGERLDLPRREIRVLAALTRRFGRTVLRESIEMAVYGFDDGIHSNALDSHVSRLRRKLADADAGLEIHAVRGVGYLMRESQ